MDITRAGTRASGQGPEDYFTGRVRFDPVITTPDPGAVQSMVVTFEPGARTNWHHHRAGQAIMVLSGLCLAQSDGGKVRELRPGDVCWFAPGERHWHGAAPEVAMSHLVIQPLQEGRSAEWAEPVSEADYTGPREGGA